eukprot:7088162-Ditylum_brightwellii.AAC.1
MFVVIRGALATVGFVGVSCFNIDTYGLVTCFFGKFLIVTEGTDGVENIGLGSICTYMLCFSDGGVVFIVMSAGCWGGNCTGAAGGLAVYGFGADVGCCASGTVLCVGGWLASDGDS